jgi:hypothetical protein
MNALVLFLAITTSTLVLRSGDRIDVQGPVQERDGVITFRSGGTLFSMPLSEVDLEATERASARRESGGEPAAAASEPPRRLRVSPEERRRLFEELAKNHSGTAPPRQPILEEPPPPKTEEEVTQAKRDEWAWRREARSYEDAVTHAREELALLAERVQQLRSQIHAFVGLGYKPSQFTYQTTQLERTIERIPRAELEVTRAERDLARFREDARRQGIPPGWLR